MTESDDSARRSFLDRLREEPPPPPPEAATRASAEAEAGTYVDQPVPPPPGATFLVEDGWDTQRGLGRSLREAGPKASAEVRRWLDLADPEVRRVLWLALLALAVVGAAAGLLVAWFHLTSDPLADAHAYYQAALRLNHGESLYPPGVDVNTNLAYFYPPLLAIVLRPLALLPYEAFALVWEGVVVVSFVLLLWRLGLRSRNTWLAVGLLGIPIGWALSVAQAHVPLTLLLAIGQPWSIALAANLKLFPALAALWWIGRRDYQATIAFLLYLVLLGLVQLVLEPAGSINFVRTVGLAEVGQVRNISPYAAIPEVWVVMFLGGIAVTLALARTSWGWPAAVALATLSPPRLLIYMLTGLLASVREPRQANLPQPERRPWLIVSGGGRH